MGGRSQGQSLCDRFMYPKHLAYSFCNDISQYAGNNDHRYRDSHHSSQFLGNSHADSCGNRLWQKCHILLVVQPEKPVRRSMFQYTVRMMAAMERRLQMLKKENVRLQNKIEEIRLVGRAKLVLMQ